MTISQILVTNRILIFGFAREGRSTLKFLRSHGYHQKITIGDDKIFANLDKESQDLFKSDKNIDYIKGTELNNNKKLQFDVIFLTPGTPLTRLPTRLWPIATSQTQIFLAAFAKQTIGITGTKGKSTTASLIYEILKNTGKNVVLLGNIGNPALDFFDKIAKDTVIVFELSSHQLSLVKTSPHIAIFLNIFPEHLDYYKSLATYRQAKENITKFQSKTDFLITNDKITTQATVYPIIPPLSPWPTKLLGDFNQFNIAAAWQAVELLGISQTLAQIAVAEFEPLEHRLEFVGTFHKISFYNDSISTVPEATIQALNTFGDQVETLLLGGFDRGIKYTHLIQRIEKSRVKNLILFPTTGQKILAELKNPDNFKIFQTASMEKAVEFAYQNTSFGKIILLSPASTSFNLFKDYQDRGQQFKEWVVKLGKTT